MTTPPGPKGHRLLGVLPDFRKDPIALLTRLRREYGEVSRLQGALKAYYLAHPDDIKHVFDANWPHPDWFNAVFAIPGDGVASCEGEVWRQRRSMLEPDFTTESVAPFAPVIVDAAEQFTQRWGGGKTLDIHDEMDALSQNIMGRAIYGDEDWAAHGKAIGRACNVFFDHVKVKMPVRAAGAPAWFPNPISDRRFRIAKRAYDAAVLGTIAERRRTGRRGNDMLSRFLELRDADGEPLDGQAIAGHLTQVFIAGHATGRNALAWTWYLLSEHPEAAERLRGELSEVLGGRAPALEDLLRLPFTAMVVNEALRMYPPLWLQPRSPSADAEIRGYTFPAGTQTFVSGYVTHRHPDFWERPETFDPERFDDERSASRPAHAFMPFAHGPRHCLGMHFAVMELRLVVATLAQRYRFQLVPGSRVEMEMLFTLEPRYGLPMTAERL